MCHLDELSLLLYKHKPRILQVLVHVNRHILVYRFVYPITLENLEWSASWFLGFLERNDHWITNYAHKHLSKTRAIKSLGLFTSDLVVDAFKDKVIALAGDTVNLVDQKTRDFWASAQIDIGTISHETYSIRN